MRWRSGDGEQIASPWFNEPSRGSQEKRSFSNGLFSIQSEGLACNLTAGEYVIAEGVWHHASACILLRIDYIQHFVLLPYRRQAADFIHGFAVILRVAFLYYEPTKKTGIARLFCWMFLQYGEKQPKKRRFSAFYF